MKENINFEAFFKNLRGLSSALLPLAKRNSITPQATLLLYTIYINADLSDFFKEDCYSELLERGFVTCENDIFSPTGKGSILAKSLEIMVKKFEAEQI